MASAEEHGGADEDADLQGAEHVDAASASSGDDVDVESVDTDGSGDSGDDEHGGARAQAGDNFEQFFQRHTCVGHTCSSGALAGLAAPCRMCR